MSVEFLLEMAWKSALISGAVLALVALLRTRSADERAAVLRAGFAFILLLPAISLLFPELRVEAFAAPDAPAPVGDSDLVPLAMSASTAAADASYVPAAPALSTWDDPTPLILIAYAAGVLMVALRLFAGLWTLRAWTRSATSLSCPRWRDAFERAEAASGCTSSPRLLVADVPSPLSWGWLRPVILIDPDSARDSEEADAIVAHELAHLARRDWLVLILARVAVAFFWFNPLVWLLERQLTEQAEEAADARAVEHVEPARYAQTLVSCAHNLRGSLIPATGIAPHSGSLARRVAAILRARLGEQGPDRRSARLAAALCVLLAAPIAALKPVAAEAPVPPEAPAAPAAIAMIPAPPAPMTVSLPHVVPMPPAPALPPIAMAVPAVVAPPSAPNAQVALAVPARPALAIAPPVPPRFAFASATAPTAPRGRGRRVRSSSHGWTEEDQRELDRKIRESVAEAMRGVEEAGRRAEQAGAIAEAAVRRGMAQGAAGMAQGAAGMERGAHQMEAAAEKLRSKAYREVQIARAARRGETLTHEELIESIPEMKRGAREMREGAVEMRRGAEKMRDGCTD